jgi:hypothetical protein
LFNVAKDPGERRDLAKELPDKVRELNQRLTDYLAVVKAQLPKPNPAYDPGQPTQPAATRRYPPLPIAAALASARRSHERVSADWGAPASCPIRFT